MPAFAAYRGEAPAAVVCCPHIGLFVCCSGGGSGGAPRVAVIHTPCHPAVGIPPSVPTRGRSLSSGVLRWILAALGRKSCRRAARGGRSAYLCTARRVKFPPNLKPRKVCKLGMQRHAGCRVPLGVHAAGLSSFEEVLMESRSGHSCEGSGQDLLAVPGGSTGGGYRGVVSGDALWSRRKLQSFVPPFPRPTRWRGAVVSRPSSATHRRQTPCCACVVLGGRHMRLLLDRPHV